jgi:nucleotide-binding universal stress UspA family protein
VPASNDPVVLVGVDHSPDARGALSWAAGYAAMAGGALLLIHAYRYPLAYRGTGATPDAVDADEHRAAQHLVEELATAIRAEHPDVPVDVAVHHDRGAAHALVDRSKEASLLVVGSHGDGSMLRRFTLGSVAFHCVGHAHCPVVVTRDGTLSTD